MSHGPGISPDRVIRRLFGGRLAVVGGLDRCLGGGRFDRRVTFGRHFGRRVGGRLGRPSARHFVTFGDGLAGSALASAPSSGSSSNAGPM